MPKRPSPPNELPPRDPDELADKMSNGQSAVPARRLSGREEVDLRHSYSGCRHRSHLAPTANPARRSRRSHRQSTVADGSSARRCSRTGSAAGSRFRRTARGWAGVRLKGQHRNFRPGGHDQQPQNLTPKFLKAHRRLVLVLPHDPPADATDKPDDTDDQDKQAQWPFQSVGRKCVEH